MLQLVGCLLILQAQVDSSAVETDASDRCAVCKLTHQALLQRLGTQGDEEAVTEAVEAVCNTLRVPGAGMSQEDGRKLQRLSDACATLVDSHGDEIVEALVDKELDMCGRLPRVCGAAKRGKKRRHTTARGKPQSVERGATSSVGPASTPMPFASPPAPGQSSDSAELAAQQDCELCGLLMHKLEKEQRRQHDNQRTAAALARGGRDSDGAKQQRNPESQRVERALAARLDRMVESESAYTVCSERAARMRVSVLSTPTEGAAADWDACEHRTIERGKRLRTEHAEALTAAALQGSGPEVCTKLLDGCTGELVRKHVMNDRVTRVERGSILREKMEL